MRIKWVFSYWDCMVFIHPNCGILAAMVAMVAISNLQTSPTSLGFPIDLHSLKLRVHSCQVPPGFQKETRLVFRLPSIFRVFLLLVLGILIWLGGGNSNIFYFHPYLGRWSNLTNIFQMGWNHQLDDCYDISVTGSLEKPGGRWWFEWVEHCGLRPVTWLFLNRGVVYGRHQENIISTLKGDNKKTVHARKLIWNLKMVSGKRRNI